MLDLVAKVTRSHISVSSLLPCVLCLTLDSCPPYFLSWLQSEGTNPGKVRPTFGGVARNVAGKEGDFGPSSYHLVHCCIETPVGEVHIMM